MKTVLETLAALLVLASAAAAQVAPTGSWVDRAPAPLSVYGGGSASDGTYLYVFGGFTGSTAVASHYRYNPIANQWSALASMPSAIYYNSGVAFNGSLYSFGASPASGQIARYDIAGNSWTTLAATVPNGAANSAAVLGNLVYITGGVTGGSTTNATSEFDPATGNVRALAPMPASFGYHGSAAVVSTNRLYIMGGNASATPTSAGVQSGCYEFNPTSNAWTTKAPVGNGSNTLRRDDFRAFAVGRRVYVAGGGDGGAFQPTVLEYAPATDTWLQRASMPIALSFPFVGNIGAKVYVACGYTPSLGTATNRLQEFTPPAFGLPPNLPTNLAQSVPAGGWTGATIKFSANLSDPDAGALLRLEVEVRPAGAAWTGAPSAASAYGPPGLFNLEYTIPAAGDYDWRCRVIDEEGNQAPAAPSWIEFSAASPDFRSDQIAPSVPSCLSPVGIDAVVMSRQGGAVSFAWTPSTDDNAGAVTYDVEIVGETSEAGITVNSATFNLPTSPNPRSWRVRSHDLYGNVSAWSAVAPFRVIFVDSKDHAAGDATKVCGMASTGSSTPLIGFLLLAALLSAIRASRASL